MMGTPAARLTDFSNNRSDHWEVAADSWTDRPLVGQGAGTFALEWAQGRPNDFTVVDAHSLYLEVLAELGILGLLFLAAALVTVLVGVARRCTGPDRVVHGAIFALIAAWVAHAGIDWDWELPAVSIIPFALAGAALASTTPRVSSPARLTRVVVGIGMIVIALTPVSIALSQARLNAAVAAVRDGDCAAGAEDALSSIDALPVRPEPYELLAYCNAGAGNAESGRAHGSERDRSRPGQLGAPLRAGDRAGDGGRGPARRRAEGGRTQSARHAGARPRAATPNR